MYDIQNNYQDHVDNGEQSYTMPESNESLMDQSKTAEDEMLGMDQPQAAEDAMAEMDQPQAAEDAMAEMDQPQAAEDAMAEMDQPQAAEDGMAEMDQHLNSGEGTLYSPSNAGTPIESSNIPVNVDDGNDIEKLDFSSQYTNPNGTGDDLLAGIDGVNIFEINPLLNAKPEIYQQHTDAEGKIDWHGVTGENNNYHDHWLDGIGQDTIMDFSGSGGDGDKVNIAGHTVAVTVLEESDNQIKLGLYSDQGADGSRGGDAHDFDVLGTLTINHDGNFNYGSDVTVNPNVADGAFEFA